MDTLRYYKKRLRSLIAERQRELLTTIYPNEQEEHAVYAEYSRQITAMEISIKIKQSQDLIEKAARFGIDLATGFGPWSTDPTGRASWLEDKEQIRAKNLIADARFVYWERWAKILVPILSLLIAIIALLKK